MKRNELRLMCNITQKLTALLNSEPYPQEMVVLNSEPYPQEIVVLNSEPYPQEMVIEQNALLK